MFSYLNWCMTTSQKYSKNTNKIYQLEIALLLVISITVIPAYQIIHALAAAVPDSLKRASREMRIPAQCLPGYVMLICYLINQPYAVGCAQPARGFQLIGETAD